MEHYRIKNDTTPYIAFPVLDELDWLRHACSTRLGGVSTGIHATMNLGFQNGDLQTNVYENYRRICTAIGVTPETVVHARQTHKDRVRVVTAKDRGKGYNRKRDYDDIDALITNEPEVTLTILTADCVPVFLIDPVMRAIGLAHSGWRGTVARIAAKTVQCMHDTYGSNPKDIIAVTGPCICCECYEVGDEVAEAFRDEFGPKVFERISKLKNGKAHINLSETIAQSLLQIGVEEVTQSNFCTACNSDILFSHRVTQGKRGTLASFLSIIG